MFLNIPETTSARKTTPPSSKSAEHGNSPTANQLWSVIEFSRQFPDLTLSLVADLKATELAATKRIQTEESAEQLEFPPLVVPDLKERRTQKRQHDPSEDEDIEKEIALFAAGELPPEPLLPPVTSPKEKMQIWQYLLTFFALFLLFLWLHSGMEDTVQPQSDHIASRQ
ncbi:MAG: hypothetical protein CDV28_10392 [Candidatus Electronema aureum]|uniref:Uncharacterized protein n=1 Tax=Candidatus Electronema aureum TaxID=2005002 RepID=A0A521G4E1_9BACT|nr:MAG: hypothetical protein CDV28_10392 [Candidatus Electronema aureum]